MKITVLAAILLLAIGLLTTKTLAQANLITIRIVDNLTKKPVKDAMIYTPDSISSKTNYLGFSQTKAIVGDTLLVSCADYDGKFFIVPAASKFQVGLDIKDEKLDYTGGITSFYDHWKRNLRYPGKARSEEKQAAIYVEFKVDSMGQSSLIKIYNDPDGFFEQEINAVFKSMTGKWSRDYSNKTFLLPITFRLLSISPPEYNNLIDTKPDRTLNEIVVALFSVERTRGK